MAFVLCSQKKDFAVVVVVAVVATEDAVEEEAVGEAAEEAMEEEAMGVAEEVADLRVIMAAPMAAPTVEVAGGHMDTPTVGHTAGPSLTQSIVIGIDME